MEKKYHSVFDIIGPIMVGPSSSHTAGAVKIGLMARALFQKQPESVDIYLYESFAETYKGHGTDIALVGGLLNLSLADPNLKESLEIATKENLKVNFILEKGIKTLYPNTVKLVLKKADQIMSVVGVSVGGGKALITEINQVNLEISDDLITIVIFHHDKPGMIYQVSKILSEKNINIATMKVRRSFKGSNAMMIIEIDNSDLNDSIALLKAIPFIDEVILINLNQKEQSC